MPAIIEAWFLASENTMPVRAALFRMVDSAAWLDDEAGGEQQRRLLAVQVGEFGLQRVVQPGWCR